VQEGPVEEVSHEKVLVRPRIAVAVVPDYGVTQ